MSEKRERAKKIYEWSSRQTGEAQEFKEDEFYWTETCKKALMRLVNTQSILLGITGLQGTGKSSALTALEKSLSSALTEGCHCIRYKWSREWKQQFISCKIKSEESYHYELLQTLLDEKPEKIRTLLQTSPDDLKHWLHERRALLRSVKTEKDEQKLESIGKLLLRIEDDLNSSADDYAIQNILGEKSVNALDQILLDRYIAHIAYILVDMPDYVKTDFRAMNKDIDELQHMWSGFMGRGQKTSLVVAIQKEIVMKRPHFFFGKFSMLELKPLTPQQLLEAYRLKWKTDEPFIEDSLLLIAKLSRGVFRRFLKYLNLTLEKILIERKDFPATSKDVVTIKDVEDAVSFDVLLADMELEFADFFTQQAHKLQAAKILQLVRLQTLTQKQIADKLNVSESMVTKLIGKLELYGYVKRNRGEGNTWLVSLA